VIRGRKKQQIKRGNQKNSWENPTSREACTWDLAAFTFGVLYSRTCTRTHAHMRTHLLKCTSMVAFEANIFTYTCICICMCIYVLICVCIYIHTFICIYIHIYIHIHVYIYKYIYIYIYIHTYTYVRNTLVSTLFLYGSFFVHSHSVSLSLLPPHVVRFVLFLTHRHTKSQTHKHTNTHTHIVPFMHTYTHPQMYTPTNVHTHKTQEPSKKLDVHD